MLDVVAELTEMSPSSPVRNSPSYDIYSSLAEHNFDLDFETAGRLFRSGLLVVDHTRRVLATNQIAAELLQDSEGLSLINGCLSIEKAYVQRSFGFLLVQLRAAAGPGRFVPAQCALIGVPDRKGAVRYALKVMAAELGPQRAEFLLAIIDLADRAGPSREAFSAVFRLSEREAELAELFSRGFRLEQIASMMGVSLNTARVHLRNVFAKTNCAGQSELMRMFTRLT